MSKPDDLDLSVMFPSEYLKAADFGGKSWTLTIAKVGRDNVAMTGGRKSPCTLLQFRETRKKLITNKTNGYALALLLSPNLAKPNGRDWIGHKVTFCADMDVDRRTKEDVAAIRIAGSPDASQERAEVYDRAWQGPRAGGDLCHRLKRALATAAVRGLAPPIVPRPEPEPEANAGQPAPDPDIFDDAPEPGSDG